MGNIEHNVVSLEDLERTVLRGGTNGDVRIYRAGPGKKESESELSRKFTDAQTHFLVLDF